MGWYPERVTVRPVGDGPVTVAEAKLHARIDGDDEDTNVALYIGAAIQHIQKKTDTYLAEQTVEVRVDCFHDLNRLQIAPVKEVTSISYTDMAGDVQTVPEEEYEVRVDRFEASIRPAYGQQWPLAREGSRVTLIAIVGYETLPDDIKYAILLHVAASFETREDKATLARTVADDFLTNHRFYR